MSKESHAYLALAAVCFLWGTTYLGIRMALEAVSPLMLMGIRYTLSGFLLLLATFVQGARMPRGREMVMSCLYGLLIIGVGTGALSFAETLIPSGLAALLVTVSPFWMVSLEACMPKGQRLHGPTLVGLLLGLIGVAILIGPTAFNHGIQGPLIRGFLVLQIGCLGWAVGSILQRHRQSTVHPIVIGAVQQAVTGLVYLVFAFFTHHTEVKVVPHGLGALLYLVVFGGVIGYSAYIYALANLPVSVVSIYVYINPIIALMLGWLFYREPIGVRGIAAMLVVFCGVAVVKHFGTQVKTFRPEVVRLQDR